MKYFHVAAVVAACIIYSEILLYFVCQNQKLYTSTNVGDQPSWPLFITLLIKIQLECLDACHRR